MGSGERRDTFVPGPGLTPLLAAAAIVLAGAAAARAEDGVQAAAAKAVERGLAYLVKTQEADGAWTEIIGRKVNEEYQGRRGKHIAVTAIACTSLLASGAKPGEGDRGAALEKGLGWLLARQKLEVGDFWVDGATLYDHAFATRCLARAMAAKPDAELKKRLDLAVDALRTGQNAQGGWRYKWGSTDADLSVTACCLLALCEARDAGAVAPDETVARAVGYVKRSAIDSAYPSPDMGGGFWYQVFDTPIRSSRTSFALAAAGTAALLAAGEAEAPQARAGLDFLKNRPRWRPPAYRMNQSFDYFYAYYFAADAAARSKDAAWLDPVRDDIVQGQHRDGYWEDLVGRNYATGMATLILQRIGTK